MSKTAKVRWRLSRNAKISLTISTLLVIIGIPTAVQAMTLTEAAPTETVTISLFQAILIGLGYYLSQGPWIAGLSFYTLNRPLVAGLLVGLILGNPGQGALIGAAINLIYLGFISAGGAIPGDPGLAGWVGTTIAIAGSLNYGAALALAVPIGLLGTVIWNARMTVDSAFMHMADRAADKADVGGVIRANVLYPQAWLFLITFVPVTIAVFLGAKFIGDVINGFPVWLLGGLAIAGGILPAIGIAMNMKFIFMGTAIPYFFVGYLIMVVLGNEVSIMVLAVIGVALAFLHVAFLGDRVKTAAKPESKKLTKAKEAEASR
ncbi:MAG: PTS sugar transporter subunit IIC [Microbacteriaceae bacterium]|mgnify:CR=1 FL=1|nr:PTS sugar transporter subunit IIC [Cryobacterium sp.]MBX3104688.1 PTS sugar transporter subunit IIC [Cryobacterium sp.]MCC6376596.1 PTS sugar transporter subunit IIC [Microbacteriaceae bacterium]